MRIGYLMMALALLVSGCFSKPRLDFPEGQDRIELAMPPGQVAVPKVFDEYQLSAGDELDVLFQIQTWRPGEGEANAEPPAYQLTIDDVITVKFVHAPELNETQRVRPDGSISLPYVGQVPVVGLTVQQVTQALIPRYAEILQDPELFVVPSEIRNQIRELKVDLRTSARGLSRLVTIRPDGYVTFPLVGSLFVAGRTIAEVETELNDRYGRYLRGLHVDLFLQQQAGSVVYVMGEVNSPGAYPLRKPSTVLEAIALAGSYTTDAKLNSIMLIRAQNEKVVATRVDLMQLTSLRSSLSLLHPDDVILVPRTEIAHMAELMQQVADVFLFNGWGSNWPLSNRSMIDHIQ